MRQATPHIQWFSLVFADDSVRHEFLAALEDNPPVAILLTNSQWPQPDGFDAADGWAKFAMLCHLQAARSHSLRPPHAPTALASKGPGAASLLMVDCETP
jgi:hypothetical protein